MTVVGPDKKYVGSEVGGIADWADPEVDQRKLRSGILSSLRLGVAGGRIHDLVRRDPTRGRLRSVANRKCGMSAAGTTGKQPGYDRD